MQSILLNKLGVSEKNAFLTNIFVPSELRRNIAALGGLHKRVLGKCHRTFEALFPWQSQYSHMVRGFHNDKQLYDHRLEMTNHRALILRFIFEMADVYISSSEINAG